LYLQLFFLLFSVLVIPTSFYLSGLSKRFIFINLGLILINIIQFQLPYQSDIKIKLDPRQFQLSARAGNVLIGDSLNDYFTTSFYYSYDIKFNERKCTVRGLPFSLGLTFSFNGEIYENEDGLYYNGQKLECR
jgi:hypothetical protein